MSKNAQLDILWKHGAVVLTLARFGHLDKAAKILKVNRSTMSRRLHAVEHAIGYRIFESTKGNFTPTEKGAGLIECLEKADGEINKANIQQDNDNMATEVNISISLPPHFLKLIAPYLTAFNQQHKFIRINLDVSYQLVDIEMQHADIAIRVSKQEPKYPLIAEKLMDLHGAYYKASGVAAVDTVYVCSQFEDSPSDEAKGLFDIENYITTSDYYSQIELIKEGGLGRTIHELARHETSLEMAHGELFFAGWHLWIVNHASTKYIATIKLVTDYLISIFNHKIEH